ncbi:sterile alpha motif domain-containing protein 12-like [Babylonia areolata]|uniref:sterile alpha motif domain-containing protein 12-like n=1 Tax=Babylonia areolata TaxID=304850 RepID=UPI003FD24F41
MSTQVADGGGSGDGGGGGKTEALSPQSLHPPGKESVSSSGSTSGTDGAPRKVLKGKPKPLYFWTSADVNKWWRKHGGRCYEQYGDLLTKHDVGGRTLIRMNEIKLEKIGITNVEDRHELMQHILRLRLKHEMADLKNLDQRGVGFDLKLPDPRPAAASAGEKSDKTDKSGTGGATTR